MANAWKKYSDTKVVFDFTEIEAGVKCWRMTQAFTACAILRDSVRYCTSPLSSQQNPRPVCTQGRNGYSSAAQRNRHFWKKRERTWSGPFRETRKGPALILAPLAERHAAHGMDEPLDNLASPEMLCFRFLRRMAVLPPLSSGRTAAAEGRLAVLETHAFDCSNLL